MYGLSHEYSRDSGRQASQLERNTHPRTARNQSYKDLGTASQHYPGGVEVAHTLDQTLVHREIVSVPIRKHCPCFVFLPQVLPIGAMAHETATTASVADFDDFHNGMQQLAQHNIATRYGRDQQTFDSNGYPLSGSNSVYSTPEPGHLIVDQYGRTYNGPYVDHYQEALEAQTVS